MNNSCVNIYIYIYILSSNFNILCRNKATEKNLILYLNLRQNRKCNPNGPH